MGFGIWKLLLLLAVVLVIFGSGKLPSAIKDIGKGIKSLRDGLSDGKDDEPASDNGEKAIIVNKEPASTNNKKKKS